MDRTPDDRSNPLRRAFSKFLERGRVGNDAKASPAPTAQAPARRAAAPAARPAAPLAGSAGPSARAAGTHASSAPAQPQPTRPAPTATPPAASTPQAAAPTPTATRRTHTVVRGDTLSDIAQQVYGRADRWRMIFEANRHMLDDPDRIYPGQVLVIPDAPSVH